MRDGYRSSAKHVYLLPILLAAAMLLADPAAAQRQAMSINVPNTEPFILSQAIEQAVEGDTLVLVTSGSDGAYLDTALHVNKTLTFMADPGLPEPPLVHFHWEEKPEGGSGHQFILEAGDVTVDGIVFGRAEEDSLNQVFSVEGDEARTIRLLNSEFRHGSKMIQNTTPGDVDTLIIENSYIHDFDRNAVQIEFAPDAENLARVHNSTFANVRNAVDMRGGGSSSVLDADHVTVDRANFAFDVQKVDSDWSLDSHVRNSIVSRSRTALRWNGYYPADPDSALIANSLIFDLQNAFGNEAQTNETILEGDPLFVEPDTWPYDFSVQEGSPAVGAATDGTTLGDPRWESVGTSAGDPAALPHSAVLDQNYPNPFNPSTEIAFELSSRAKVTLTVYDAVGRQVRTLIDGNRPAGGHSIRFDATGLPSGTYFYRLVAGNEVRTRSMTVVK